MSWWNRVYLGSCEAMSEIPDAEVHMCVTSPPYYGLRDYQAEGQIGLESTLAEYVDRLVAVFREVRRCLRDDGTLWLNLGDSYAGSWGAQGREGAMADRSIVAARSIAAHPKKASNTGTIRDAGLKPKDLMGVPWEVAFALRRDGWYLRDAITWAKPNPMPSSVEDRCTPAYEMIFMLAKRPRYFADMDAVRTADSGKPSGNGFVRPERLSYGGRGNEGQWEPGGGANLRNVWTIATTPYPDAHFATFPIEIPSRCIRIGCPPGGIVLDPFLGSGTTAQAAEALGRRWVGYEINDQYLPLIAERTRQVGLFSA